MATAEVLNFQNDAVNWFGKNDINYGCDHSYLSDEGICEECGVMIEEKINYNAEWKNYGGGDKTTKNTIQRCHSSKAPVKGNIDSLFIGKDIPKFIQDKITFFYDKMKNGNTVRSNNRTSMVAACYYYVCIDEKQYKTSEEVQTFFNIDGESFSTGLNKFLENFKEYSKIDINPTHLFKYYLINLKIDLSHYDNLVKFYNKLPKNNQKLNQCKLKSITVGIMYIYMNITEPREDVKKNKKEFSKLAELSEITITKVVDIISGIIKDNNISVL